MSLNEPAEYFFQTEIGVKIMLKANLIKQFNYCNAIANDIIEHNKSKEIQEYAKQFAEIESPLVGGTGADWIRINWGGYLYIPV